MAVAGLKFAKDCLAQLAETRNRPSLFATVAASSVAAVICYKSWSARRARSVRDGARTPAPLSSGAYDVAIVGAGPAGSTAAYYLAKQGLRVVLLEKKSFPRAKPCGDGWCEPAIRILEDMGCMAKMEEAGVVKKVMRGGFVSPSGFQCINTDSAAYGSHLACRTYAIKRRDADVFVARAAAEAGAELREEVDVGAASFKKAAETWLLSTSKGEVEARMLLIADGSTSYLGQKLGLVPEGSRAEAECSHAYAKAGTHQWTDADGVMFFNKSVLPGYSAIFRHSNDDVYLGTYILPGGRATSRAIPGFEADLQARHPYVKEALGSNVEWVNKRVVAPIRLGGIRSTYGQQVLLVGDAAGFVDPMTGEGIHTAMESGQIAAEVLGEMFKKGNFGPAAHRAYDLRCYDRFGFEFWVSSLAARLIYHMPIILDAVAIAGSKQGQWFLDFFGQCMTGVRPKSDFLLRPGLVLGVSAELLRQLFLQKVLRVEPPQPTDIGLALVEDHWQKRAAKK